MILQLLGISILVYDRQALKHHVKEWNKIYTYLTLIQPFSSINLFIKSLYFSKVQALQEITPNRHL